MSDPSSRNFLQKEGGLFPIAGGVIVALAVLYMLYFFGGFGSPEIKNFRDQCHQRELRESAHLAIRPDYDGIVVKCEHELRDFLSRRTR
jgi:hypothetical protein